MPLKITTNLETEEADEMNIMQSDSNTVIPIDKRTKADFFLLIGNSYVCQFGKQV